MAEWIKKADENHSHTASTMYEKEGFRVWKGKYRVFSCIYSANEWHLERKSDHKIAYSAKTAKECRKVLDNAIERGVDVNTVEIVPGLINF